MTFSQTKTPQGYLPFRAVSLMMPGTGNEAAHIDEPSFAFDVYTAREMVDARKRGIEIPTAPHGCLRPGDAWSLREGDRAGLRPVRRLPLCICR